MCTFGAVVAITVVAVKMGWSARPFEAIKQKGEASADTLALINALFMLVDIVVAVFVEKTTPKTSRNSGVPSSRDATQTPDQLVRESVIEQQLHEVPNDTSRRSRSAANARQARMSSRVKSGKSSRTSCSDMPEAR